VIAALVLAMVPLAPSADCYRDWDDQWCLEHGVELAATKPVFADLATDRVGGYQPGDRVPTGHGDSAVVPREALEAVAGAGPKLGELVASHDEARLLVDLAACESRFDVHADGPGTSRGAYQFIASTWSRVAAATGYADIGSWADQAVNALWLGRHGGWQHWTCWAVVR
jgi:hypothetical protein